MRHADPEQVVIDGDTIEQFIAALHADRHERPFDAAALDTAEAAPLTTMFQEAEHVQAKYVAGPHAQAMQDIDSKATRALQQVHPELGLNALAYESYRDQDTTKVWKTLGRRALYTLNKINTQRSLQIARLGYQVGVDQGPTEPFMFSTAPFAAQGKDSATLMYRIAAQGCLNACFRMVLAGITDTSPVRESSVALGLFAATGELLADDDTYTHALMTPMVATQYPEATIRVVSIQGANLNTVTGMVRKLTAGRPERRVIPIVSLLSQAADISSGIIMHTNVLQSVNNRHVTVHDPALLMNVYENFGENRQLPLESFYRRWMFSMNRAHLVVADKI